MIIYVKFLIFVFLYSITYDNLTIEYSTDTSSTDTRTVGPRLLDEVGHKSETGSTDTNHDKKSRLESAGG
nr:hypothetical protein MACL_00002398 [Theileria orientalis]